MDLCTRLTLRSLILLVIAVFDLSSWPSPRWNDLQMQIKPQNFWTFSLPNYKEEQWSIITCRPARLPLNQRPNSALSPLVHQAPQLHTPPSSTIQPSTCLPISASTVPPPRRDLPPAQIRRPSAASSSAKQAERLHIKAQIPQRKQICYKKNWNVTHGER